MNIHEQVVTLRIRYDADAEHSSPNNWDWNLLCDTDDDEVTATVIGAGRALPVTVDKG